MEELGEAVEAPEEPRKIDILDGLGHVFLGKSCTNVICDVCKKVNKVLGGLFSKKF